MDINYSKNFSKHFDKAPVAIQKSFLIRLNLFVKDKNHSLLRNHKLLGAFAPYRSINISEDWRAIYREIDNGRTILFQDIGTHNQLYK